MTRFLSRIGPGMMLAAASIGLSHLVFSTQAGGNYGLSLVWFVIAVVLLKYPAFRFAVQYASATGDSLVNGYAKIGKLAVAWLLVGFFVDMFIATSAVAVLTAGMVISVFGLPYHAPQVAVVLTVVTAVVLANGHYAKAENIVKFLVLLFSVLVVVTMLFALPLLGSDERGVFATLTPDRALAVFMIGLAGWMPIPTNAAVLVAEWVKEKHAATKGKFSSGEALFDFHLSFGLTLIIALCFIVMGTAILFDTGRETPGNPAAYATELFGLFTQVIGGWTYPIIAAAGLAVMWSTQVALMDALPRVMNRLTLVISGREDTEKNYYTPFLILQVAGVAVIVLFLMGSFGAFLVFATSMGFVAAPAIAYYNYRAVTSADVPEALRPGARLVLWNWLGVLFMAIFAIGFFYTLVS